MIGKKCSRVSRAEADQYIAGSAACTRRAPLPMHAGYTVALDMTARDIQDEAKKKGHPWSVAKAGPHWGDAAHVPAGLRHVLSHW